MSSRPPTMYPTGAEIAPMILASVPVSALDPESTNTDFNRTSPPPADPPGDTP
jgi:hypothetical protein